MTIYARKRQRFVFERGRVVFGFFHISCQLPSGVVDAAQQAGLF